MDHQRIPVIAVLMTAGALLAPLTIVSPASAAPLPCSTDRPYRDLDGDGFEDVVIGDPYATVAGQAEAGTVTILFGDTDGEMGGGGRRILTQDDLGETPEAGDHFGWAVTTNRTDITGCTGILIGVPGEDVAGKADAGMGHVLTINTGSEAVDEGVSTFDQADLGGTVEAGDELGYSVAAFGGRNENPVTFAFGAPGENNDGGVVNRIDTTQLPSSGVQERQGARGVPGTLQAGDRFGEVIRFANYLPVEDDDDFYLYVGVPGDRVSGHAAAGSVTAVSKYSRSRVITEDTSGIPGSAEAGDRFGSSLASHALPPVPTTRLLAVGAPGEDVGKVKNAGSVTVLKRASDTGEALEAVTLTQSTPGMAGSVEAGDRFGAAITFRDDRTLAVGSPGENVGSVSDAGTVNIVRVGRSALSYPSPVITEDSPGTPGTVRADNRFGSVVVGLPSTDAVSINEPEDYGEAVFAISSPFHDGGYVYALSSTQEPRAWLPAPDQDAVRFGHAVG